MKTRFCQPIKLIPQVSLFCLISTLCFGDEDSEQGSPISSAPVEVAEAKMVQTLKTRERSLDPFGLSMNPNVEASLEIVGPELNEIEGLPKTSLQEALERLTITGVIPRRQAVIIGPRTLRAGEKFVIEKDTFVFNLQLAKVELKGITVIDLDSSESAFLPLLIGPSLGKGGPAFSPEQFQPQGSVLTIR